MVLSPRLLWLWAPLILMSGYAHGRYASPADESIPAPLASVAPALLPVESRTPPGPVQQVVLHEVAPNESPATILAGYGLSPRDIHEMDQAARSAGTKSFGRLMAGAPLRLTLLEEKLVKYESLGDPSNVLTVQRASGDDSAWTAAQGPLDAEVRQRVASGIIKGSLFVTADALGLDDALIIHLADLFKWDVDFNLEVREGDSFAVVFEERVYDDPHLGDRPAFAGILAAKFVNRGSEHVAVRFGEDSPDYYDENGQSLRKQFLKSPLAFGRVTSRFSLSRAHPVTGVSRPHLGIDIAAPTGTPILATADGTVRELGWKGGYGRHILLRHPNGYASEYGHMSRYAKGLKKGDKVRQGQVIGYVGSSGLSTGPHVHYGVMEDGKFKNPDKLKWISAGPVPAKHRDGFNLQRDRMQDALSSALADTGIRDLRLARAK